MTGETRKMTRARLVELLEREAYLTAAERVRAGEDAVRVLRDCRPFILNYNDDQARETVATFQAIVAGEIEVEATWKYE